MRRYKSKIIKAINICRDKISFKDKGLILIMIIFLLQSMHNLYTVEPTDVNYMSINIIIRTSIAGIFGYFLSANFLSTEDKKDKSKEGISYKSEDLEQLLKDKEIESEYHDLKKNNDTNKKYFCNRGLQNIIAVGICIIVTIPLIIGVDFKLIPDGSIATIAQFRDLISGSIGFLLGNSRNDKKNTDK